MREFLRTLGLALLVVTGVAFAADAQQRFPTPRITLDQWNEYLKETLAIPGIDRKESTRQITLTDSRTMTIYAFTQPGNPAHPGVVVRVLVSGPDGYSVRRIGHYVGDASIFEKWWHEFDALDDRIRREMSR